MEGKVVIITGASSGIGRASALLFAQAGAIVVAVGRNEKELNALRSQAKNLGGIIKSQLADICETTQVERIINDTFEQFGQIDVLINAAGIILNGSIENTDLEDWDKMMNVNVRSMFYIINRAIPHLEKSAGNIVNVSSVAGPRSFPNVLAYCVSKSAVDQLTRCAALELASKQIRVNAVNPGVTVTNLHKRSGMKETDYENFLEHSKSTHPIGRVGEPKEIAELIYFLASDKASWITGATYEIDGGRALTCAR